MCVCVCVCLGRGRGGEETEAQNRCAKAVAVGPGALHPRVSKGPPLAPALVSPSQVAPPSPRPTSPRRPRPGRSRRCARRTHAQAAGTRRTGQTPPAPRRGHRKKAATATAAAAVAIAAGDARRLLCRRAWGGLARGRVVGGHTKTHTQSVLEPRARHAQQESRPASSGGSSAWREGWPLRRRGGCGRAEGRAAAGAAAAGRPPQPTLTAAGTTTTATPITSSSSGIAAEQEPQAVVSMPFPAVIVPLDLQTANAASLEVRQGGQVLARCGLPAAASAAAAAGCCCCHATCELPRTHAARNCLPLCTL